MRRGFTLTELVIVLMLVAIMAAIIIPTAVDVYINSKDEIIDIYNGKQVQVIDIDTNEIIYQGDKDGAMLDGYTLVDVKYDELVIMYVRKNGR